MNTTSLLENVERRAREAKARAEKPWLFDDAPDDCPACLLEQSDAEAIDTIIVSGVPRPRAKEVLAAFYRFMTDRLGFGKYAARKWSDVRPSKGRTFIDWDGVWERLYELFEHQPQVLRLLALSEGVQ